MLIVKDNASKDTIMKVKIKPQNGRSFSNHITGKGLVRVFVYSRYKSIRRRQNTQLNGQRI